MEVGSESPIRKRRLEMEDTAIIKDTMSSNGNILLVTILDALYPINTILLEVIK